MKPRAAVAALRAHHPDYLMMITIATLLAIGLVIIYSISPVLSHKLVGSADRNFYFLNQIKFIGIGVVVWIVASMIPYPTWRKFAPYIMGIAILAMLLLLVPGLQHSKYGATRWLDFGFISVQPAEIMKVAMILYLAAWFERRSQELKSFWDGVIPFLIMVGAACFVIVVFQRDMGTMAVLAGAALGMYYAAGLKLSHLGMLVAFGLTTGVAAIAAFPHRVERFMTFLDPTKDALGDGYHISQALIAIGDGWIFGKGLGHSIQVYGYLPEAANDSIFAVIAEEFGLLGSTALVGLFIFLVYRGLKVAASAPDVFSRLVAAGISLWMLLQAIINIGAMVSLIPLTGIPLPFISYGGTSLVISLFGMGLLVNISKYTRQETGYADNRQRRRNGGSYLAGSGSLRRAKIAR